VKTLTSFFGERRVIVVLDKGIEGDEVTSHNLNDVFPHPVDIDTAGGEFLPHGMEYPFVAVTLQLSGVDKILVVLVEVVIGEVDVRDADVLLAGLLVLLCADAHHSRLVN
jgi:hypothetical protein